MANLGCGPAFHYDFRYALIANVVHGEPLALLRLGRKLANPLSASWAQSGATAGGGPTGAALRLERIDGGVRGGAAAAASRCLKTVSRIPHRTVTRERSARVP